MPRKAKTVTKKIQLTQMKQINLPVSEESILGLRN